jgi:hypothetical protein
MIMASLDVNDPLNADHLNTGSNLPTGEEELFNQEGTGVIIPVAPLTIPAGPTDNISEPSGEISPITEDTVTDEEYIQQFCPEGTQGVIIDYVRSHIGAFKDSMKSDSGKATAAPFTIHKQGPREYITLPSNWDTLMQVDEYRKIFIILSYNKIEFKLCEDKAENRLPVLATNGDLVNFLQGIINRLGGKTVPLKLNFSGKKPIERGRAWYDGVIAKKFSGEISMDRNLPAHMLYAKDVTWEKHYCGILGGSNGIKKTNSLCVLLSRAIGIFEEPSKEHWISAIEKTFITYGECIASMQRRKEKEIIVNKKKVKTMENITLNRPSKMFESVWDCEKVYLKTLDEPWDNIQRLHEKYNKSGVSLMSIVTVQEAYKTQYDLTFDINEKLTPWKRKRRTALNFYMNQMDPSKKKGDSTVYDPKRWSEVRDHIFGIIMNKDLVYADFSVSRFDELRPGDINHVSLGRWTKYTRFENIRSRVLAKKSWTDIMNMSVDDSDNLEQWIGECVDIVPDVKRVFTPETTDSQKQILAGFWRRKNQLSPEDEDRELNFENWILKLTTQTYPEYQHTFGAIGQVHFDNVVLYSNSYIMDKSRYNDFLALEDS